MKERIKYIDVAKGICMLIVLVDHAVGQYGKNGFAGEMGLNMFKLPLFFFVSGMFFSQKIILKDFIKRKFKRLVVPFCVFYITTVIILPSVLDKYANYTLGSYWGGDIYDLLIKPLEKEVSANGPIWFVWCLILINAIYLVIYVLVEKNKRYANSKYVFSVLIGICGILLAKLNINLYAHLDSAMTALPFFALGDYVYHKTDIVKQDFSAIKFGALSCFLLLFICLFAYPVNYRANSFGGFGYVLAIPFGLIGTIAVLQLSQTLCSVKRIKLLPDFLSYIGENSLIILLTHIQIQQIIGHYLDYRLSLAGWYGVLINTIITLSMCFIFVQIIKKYCPFVSGQQ